MQYVQKIIRNHQLKDKIRIVNHTQNAGIAEARNTILKEAKGQYLFLMDSDDTIVENAIEVLYNQAKAYKAEAVWGSVSGTIADKNEKKLFFQHPNMVFSNKDELGTYAFGDSNRHFLNTVWNILLNMDFLKAYNFRFDSSGYCDDYIFVHKIIPQISKAVLLSTITYNYLIREGSISHHTENGTIPSKYIKDQVIANNILKNYCKTLKQKSFYGGYCLRIYKESFFTAYTMVKKNELYDIPFSKSAIKQAISPIDSMLSTIKIKMHRKENLFFCILGNLPRFLIPPILKLLYKYRK
jgi:glycosyltransferase involved in cell wall biosynthesis